jgi:predicted small metal-binding protein
LAKTLECRDSGIPCRAKITGETEEEVLQQTVEHAREKHGADITQAKTLVRYAQSLIRDDGSPATASGTGTT